MRWKGNDTNSYIRVRGRLTDNIDFITANYSYIFFRGGAGQNSVTNETWHYKVWGGDKNSDVASYGKGNIFAIPIAIVARRNTGAFHPVYNPNGSALFSGSKKFWEVSIPTPASYDIVGVNIEDTNNDGTNDLFQFIVSGDQTENIKKDYFITVSGSTDNDGRHWVTNVEYDSDNNQTVITVSNEISSTTADGSLYSDFGYVKYCFDHADTSSGTIESGVSGRPDGLYADEINEGDVKDLRNYAPRVTDYQRILEKEFNKLLQGKMRGWEGENYVVKIDYATNEFEAGKTHIRLYHIGVYNPNGMNALEGSLLLVGSSLFKLYSYVSSWAEIRKWNGTDFVSGDFLDEVCTFSNYESNFWRNSGYKPYAILIPASNKYLRNIFDVDSEFERTRKKKNLCTCDVFGALTNYDVLSNYVKFTEESILRFNMVNYDYGESFIPTDDFSATVDSTDSTKVAISGDKRYAIKKNCRLFFRDSTNNKAGTLRVKTISYDSGNDQTIITTTVESGDSMVAGASVNVSTCIASGQTGVVSEGNQVYVFKLSRKPKDNKVKVLIRKKDGSWFAYNNFDDVSVFSVNNMQYFVNNVGSMDEEIRFNGYLNWLAIDISKIYSTLGYNDEDDFKQNAVIEIYYVTEANPLKLDSGTHKNYIIDMMKYIRFDNFGGNLKDLVLKTFGKVSEKSGVSEDYRIYEFSPIKELPSLNIVYYPAYQVTKVDFPTQLQQMGIGGAAWPILLRRNGKLELLLVYNEVLHDYEQQSVGWEGALLVANYETTSTDANGNTFIAGQKSVELPYFVWDEDEDQ